jgi:hypothetical protein
MGAPVWIVVLRIRGFTGSAGGIRGSLDPGHPGSDDGFWMSPLKCRKKLGLSRAEKVEK